MSNTIIATAARLSRLLLLLLLLLQIIAVSNSCTTSRWACARGRIEAEVE
jgi:hypothetical protein